jgi:hypothetical protein
VLRVEAAKSVVSDAGGKAIFATGLSYLRDKRRCSSPGNPNPEKNQKPILTAVSSDRFWTVSLIFPAASEVTF